VPDLVSVKISSLIKDNHVKAIASEVIALLRALEDHLARACPEDLLGLAHLDHGGRDQRSQSCFARSPGEA
jgi:hypothetical protein